MSDVVDYFEFNEVQPAEKPRTDLAKLIDAHRPGIYFGMPEEEYHADRSLSASGIKHLLTSPLTFWIKSSFNPDRKDDSTEPKERGKAFHCRLLEGAEVFASRYAVELDIADYPGALDGSKALSAHCAELGLKKSGTIAELCERIREHDPDAILWPRIVEEFEHEATAKGQAIIKKKLANEIERHARIVEAHTGTEKAFRGGFCEVSIFYVDPETGVPMKSRVDYLKSRAAVELKTFSNPMGLPLDAAVARSVATNKYFVDAAVRSESIERAKAMYRKHGAKCVVGNGLPAAEWLKAFSDPSAHAFVFLFLEAGDVPNVRIREMRRRESANGKGDLNLYWSKGQQMFREAVSIYRQCLEHYGPDLPWVDPQPMKPFVDTDFPLYAFE